jgi:hypothetical protein
MTALSSSGPYHGLKDFNDQKGQPSIGQTTAKAHSEAHSFKFSTSERKPLLATNETTELVYVDMKTWANGSRRARLDRGPVILSPREQSATPRTGSARSDRAVDADYDYTGLYAIGKRKSTFFIPKAPRSPTKPEPPTLELKPNLDVVRKRPPAWRLSRVKRFEYDTPSSRTPREAETEPSKSAREASPKRFRSTKVSQPASTTRSVGREDPVLPHVPSPRFRVATARDYGNLGVRLHHSAKDAGPQSHKVRYGGAFYRSPFAPNIAACHRLKLC